MAEEKFEKLVEPLSLLMEGFLDANPEWLAEDLGPTLVGEIPNYMVQEILQNLVDLLIADQIAEGNSEVEGEKLSWIRQ